MKKTNESRKTNAPVRPESIKDRCVRLRREADAGNDMPAYDLFEAISHVATMFRMTDAELEANLILLLDRKLAD